MFTRFLGVILFIFSYPAISEEVLVWDYDGDSEATLHINSEQFVQIYVGYGVGLTMSLNTTNAKMPYFVSDSYDDCYWSGDKIVEINFNGQAIPFTERIRFCKHEMFPATDEAKAKLFEIFKAHNVIETDWSGSKINSDNSSFQHVYRKISEKESAVTESMNQSVEHQYKTMEKQLEAARWEYSSWGEEGKEASVAYKMDSGAIWIFSSIAWMSYDNKKLLFFEVTTVNEKKEYVKVCSVDTESDWESVIWTVDAQRVWMTKHCVANGGTFRFFAQSDEGESFIKQRLESSSTNIFIDAGDEFKVNLPASGFKAVWASLENDRVL